MKEILFAALLSLVSVPITAQKEPSDSAKVEQLIADAMMQPEGTNLVVHIARQLLGIPYVGKTLEVNDKEQLVVNLRQLDCTTYVENVLALYLCATTRTPSYAAFCEQLRRIRYEGGTVAYACRLHYFTQWIDDNERLGIVEEYDVDSTLFVANEPLRLRYMTQHRDLYPAIARNDSLYQEIAERERQLDGRQTRYIPRRQLVDSEALRRAVSDGDILAIVTNKAGLDTSHIGIAVWHDDGLHLLNASSIHKRTVEEPMTLHDYMTKHPSQKGIRVIKVR